MNELLQFILSSGEQFRRARLPSLYSDFSLQRTSNPDGFTANITAWSTALNRAAKAGLIPAPGNSHDTLSLRTGEALLQALTTKEWGRPLALGTVIDEAVEKRHLIPLQEFLDAPTSIYSRKWTVQPWWLLSWTLHQLGLFERRAAVRRLPEARYAVVPNIEEAAARVVSRMADRMNLVDRIYPRQMFVKEASQALELRGDLTDSDLGVLLKFLARDKGVLVYDDQAVKFKSADEPLSPLTTQDRTIASLKNLIADLNLQITSLTASISNLTEKAQTAVKAKNRAVAMAALKSKKAAETTLTQRYGTLEQVEGVYGKIEQAADQVTLIRVMEASTGVLRNLHAQTGGVERVEDVVEGLREEMSKVDEMGQVMEEVGRGDQVVDEDAIDGELEALEQQDRVEREEKEAKQKMERLAQLEVPKQHEATAALNKEQPKESDVDADTQALRRLSLEKSPPNNDAKSAVAADG